MQEDIFVVFAPGTAGNHLANMLATDPRFNARTTADHYDHLTRNAHPRKKNIGYAKTNQRPDVFTMHLSQYIWNQNILGNESRFVVIEFPPEARTPRFMTRIHSLYEYYHDQYLLEELSTMYSVHTLSRLSGSNDITPVKVDLIFQPDSKLLVDYLTANLDIRLDPNVIDHMHSRWITMIDQ
jgi:hypothetical protein